VRRGLCNFQLYSQIPTLFRVSAKGVHRPKCQCKNQLKNHMQPLFPHILPTIYLWHLRTETHQNFRILDPLMICGELFGSSWHLFALTWQLPRSHTSCACNQRISQLLYCNSRSMHMTLTLTLTHCQLRFEKNFLGTASDHRPWFAPPAQCGKARA
jgi:hypothetical protein